FGDAFLHLLPEAVDNSGFTLVISLSLIAGILAFFVLEKIIFWRHCHVPISKEHIHPFAWMNLIGDAFHNSIDGMVIAGSYLVSPALGLATTIAVVLHEIPQEIGNYGVVIHGGFKRVEGLLMCFGVQLTAIIGALLILSLNLNVEALKSILVPFTAGGFIYIAGSDLIPELHKEVEIKRSLGQLISLSLGIGLMLALRLVK
ncbi:MAG: ZIP family metal transporter, partial [Candidatus Saganbacteria bacterium]|nr:ZIP family metal transporter [Candidatus Saganbacteria bacterium]